MMPMLGEGWPVTFGRPGHFDKVKNAKDVKWQAKSS